MTAVRKNFLAALRRWSTEGNRFMKIATRAAASAAAVGIAASGMLSLAVGTAAADPVGPGCAQYSRQVPSGPGSVMGMAADPVAVAAANNPLLKTLTAALSGQLNPKVNLVDTLNGGQFTVFAPTDDAFAKLPSATIDSEDWFGSVDKYFDLSRGPEPGRSRQRGGHSQDGARCHPDRNRNTGRLEGQRRIGDLRRSQHRQRDGVFD